MVEVELQCGVYREGTVFPLKIARDAKVSALQKAIVNEKKDVNDRFKVDPAMVTLYLAQKDGAWLKDDATLDDILGGNVHKNYKKMRSSWKLNKEELLGPAFQPGEEEIHILVELPETAAGVASDKLLTSTHTVHPDRRKRWVALNE